MIHARKALFMTEASQDAYSQTHTHTHRQAQNLPRDLWIHRIIKHWISPASQYSIAWPGATRDVAEAHDGGLARLHATQEVEFDVASV